MVFLPRRMFSIDRTFLRAISNDDDDDEDGGKGIRVDQNQPLYAPGGA